MGEVRGTHCSVRYPFSAYCFVSVCTSRRPKGPLVLQSLSLVFQEEIPGQYVFEHAHTNARHVLPVRALSFSAGRKKRRMRGRKNETDEEVKVKGEERVKEREFKEEKGFQEMIRVSSAIL